MRPRCPYETPDAKRMAERYRLQSDDGLGPGMAISAAAWVLFSQDRQDGFVIEGLRVAGPVATAKQHLLPPSSFSSARRHARHPR